MENTNFRRPFKKIIGPFSNQECKQIASLETVGLASSSFSPSSPPHPPHTSPPPPSYRILKSIGYQLSHKKSNKLILLLK